LSNFFFLLATIFFVNHEGKVTKPERKKNGLEPNHKATQTHISLT